MIFQSTLPHGSDLQYGDTTLLPDYISIHAPSRERPAKDQQYVYEVLISIHAPSRERRDDLKRLKKKHNNFNPRSLTGAT